jgi:hypothetical protein
VALLLFIIKYSAFLAIMAGVVRGYLTKGNAEIRGIKVGPEDQPGRAGNLE